MTVEMFVAAVIVGPLVGGLLYAIMKNGGYGLVGDLCLGLGGSTMTVLIFQLLGLAPYAGMAGTMSAAVSGAASLIVVQRRIWYAHA